MRLKHIHTLVEAAAGERVNQHRFPHDVHELDRVFKANCSDAQWMVDTGNPFYRGAKGGSAIDTGFAIARPSETVRTSAAGASGNYYTLFLDNHPGRENWPKRSRSFIATTDEGYARTYGSVHIIIPFNGTKIGAVNARDIWLSSATVKYAASLTSLNKIWYEFEHTLSRHFPELPKLSDTDWSTWVALDEALRKIPAKDLAPMWDRVGRSSHSEGTVSDLANLVAAHGLVEAIRRIYSPDSINPTQTVSTTKDEDYSGEMWIGGPCLVISESLWMEYQKLHWASSTPE